MGSVSEFLSYSLANRTLENLVSTTNAYRKLDRQIATYVANNWLQLNVPQPSASIVPFQECPSLEVTVRPLTNMTSNPSRVSGVGSTQTESITGTKNAAGLGTFRGFGNILG